MLQTVIYDTLSIIPPLIILSFLSSWKHSRKKTSNASLKKFTIDQNTHSVATSSTHNAKQNVQIMIIEIKKNKFQETFK